MTVGTHEETRIRAFFEKVPTCLIDGRNDATIAYFAVKKASDFVVVAARMTLGAAAEESNLPRQFETENVRAGHFRLSEIGQKPKDFVNTVVGPGEFVTPSLRLSFPGNESNAHSSYGRPFEEDALSQSKRVAVLTLNGAPKFAFLDQRTEIDWELKASQTPFNGLADLSNEYRLGNLQGSNISVDVEVPNALEIDPSSYVRDKTAFISLATQFILDTVEVTLRVRILARGQVLRRESIEGDRIEWADADDPGRQRGTLELDVPSGATVHCIAVYGQLAQHERVIVDASGENQLRLALDSVGAGAGVDSIRQALHNEGDFKNNAPALESALASLASLLGFQVLHLGLGRRTKDAVDVVARCNSGGLLLIECTMAVLKQDKVSNLVARTARLRQYLVERDFPNIQVVPVIATTMTAAELYTSVDKVERDGVLVVCREQFDEWLDLSLAAPDADRLFATMAQRLADAQGRSEGIPPFPSTPGGWVLMPEGHGHHGAIEP